MPVSEQIFPQKFPIYIIGAGGIVNTAHLPAYKLAGFNVRGIFDVVPKKAKATSAAFDVPRVFDSLEDLLSDAKNNAVFDVAVPGQEIITVLRQLPSGSN